MAKQKDVKKEFKKEVVILDSVVVKKVLSEGRKITFVEIDGDKLESQIDFGSIKVVTGNDKDGYPIRYSVRFTEDSEINKDKLEEGLYEFTTENIWIDNRENMKDKLILRIGKCVSFKCYYSFANKK